MGNCACHETPTDTEMVSIAKMGMNRRRKRQLELAVKVLRKELRMKNLIKCKRWRDVPSISLERYPELTFDVLKQAADLYDFPQLDLTHKEGADTVFINLPESLKKEVITRYREEEEKWVRNTQAIFDRKRDGAKRRLAGRCRDGTFTYRQDWFWLYDDYSYYRHNMDDVVAYYRKRYPESRVVPKLVNSWYILWSICVEPEKMEPEETKPEKTKPEKMKRETPPVQGAATVEEGEGDRRPEGMVVEEEAQGAAKAGDAEKGIASEAESLKDK